MEERFFTGYCRRIDRSRMVAAELEDGKLTEVDCDFGSCPYETDCLIARQLREAIVGAGAYGSCRSFHFFGGCPLVNPGKIC